MKDLKKDIYADIYRQYAIFPNKKLLLKILLGMDATGSKYILFMRLCSYLLKNNKKIFFKILYFKLIRYQLKYGIQISPITKIGYGLSIPHSGGIVIGGNAKIGKNCTILQGVTIGSNLYKSREHVATIGDNVLIGAGAKIIGPIKIGNNVTIGANSVVVNDIPDDVVVAGNPAKIISHKKAILINGDYLEYDKFKQLQ